MRRKVIAITTVDRTWALSVQLVQTHRRLRERLATLCDQIVEGAEGTAPHSFADDLLTHCLAFCGAVSTHHSGEDTQLLPALREAQPELAPVIDNSSRIMR